MADMTEGRLLVGRYRLTAPLGRGGMGVVWAGRDELLGREVAIKEVLLPPALTPSQQRTARKRTLREARAAARITSPAAVTVYDVVVEDDRPWIVMQRLPARTLDDLLRDDGPMPPSKVARIGLSLLDGLIAAHQAGVLHRDVKPANVMFTEDGRAVLTDFGIAVMPGEPTLTTTGMLVGSPAFMSPERARGEPPTPASDFWSLGATLYAALSGQSPFQRQSQLSTLTAIVNEDPPPLPNAGALGPIINRMLAKDPADRPDAATLRQLLTGAATVEATVAAAAKAGERAERAEQDAPRSREAAAPLPPTAPSAPAPPTPQRGPRRGAGLVALLAAVLVLAGVVTYDTLTSQPSQPREQARAPAGRHTSAPPAAAPPAGLARSPSPRTPSTSAPAVTGPAPQRSSPNTVGSVPAGFRRHQDPTGFQIAVPVGWRRSTEGTRTYFREPAGGRFLQIDQTTDPQPDALADWRRQEESVSRRLSGYRRLRLEPVDYRGWNAADWEFTWQSGNGQLHVLSRNIRVSDTRAYALYWSTPANQWAESKGFFDVFARTFQPAP
jgi:serine/threonine protein kinase